MTPPLAVLALQIAFALCAFSLLARWVVLPRLATRPRAGALEAVLWAHVPRFIALSLLAPGQIDARIPAYVATTVGVGDFASAALALSAIATLRRFGERAWWWSWACALFGAADLVVALLVALWAGVYRLPLGTGWFVLVGYVPMVCVAQLACFQVLVRPSDPKERP